MKVLSAMGRLLWRPATVLLFFPILVASVLAGWELPNGPFELWLPGGPGVSMTVIRTALWRFTTILPVVLGLIISFVVREPQHAPFGWALPELSRRLLLGKLVTGVIVAGVISLFMASVAGAEVGLPVFGWGLLCFALGGVAFDPVLSKLESRSVPLLLAAVALRPVYLDRFAASQPLVLSVLAVAAALVLLRREFSSRISRLRPVAAASSIWTNVPHRTREYWTRRSTEGRDWRDKLSTDSLASWLHAGSYESFGGARSGYGGMLAFQMLLATSIAYLVRSPQMVVIFPWIILGQSTLQLRTRFLYPISRPRRASVFFMSTLVETLIVSAATLIAVAVLFALGLEVDELDEYHNIRAMATFLFFFVVFAPVGHWAKVRRPWMEGAWLPTPRIFRYMGYQLAFMLLATLSASQFQRRMIVAPSLYLLLGAVLLPVGIYTVYWFGLRRYYSTRDLITASV